MTETQIAQTVGIPVALLAYSAAIYFLMKNANPTHHRASFKWSLITATLILGLSVFSGVIEVLIQVPWTSILMIFAGSIALFVYLYDFSVGQAVFLGIATGVIMRVLLVATVLAGFFIIENPLAGLLAIVVLVIWKIMDIRNKRAFRDISKIL